MREGWLVDPGTNWVWRFHRDDKAWVRDPKVFMDRGMAMPDGEPPLLKERRHVPQEDAETIWRNLKSMGWKRTGHYGVPQQNPDEQANKKKGRMNALPSDFPGEKVLWVFS